MTDETEEMGMHENVVCLDDYRPPVDYSIHVRHYHSGDVELIYDGIDEEDERSVDTVRQAFARACAKFLEPEDVRMVMERVIIDGALSLAASKPPGWMPEMEDVEEDPSFAALCNAAHHYDAIMARFFVPANDVE
jgi:hypothetical protein